MNSRVSVYVVGRYIADEAETKIIIINSIIPSDFLNTSNNFTPIVSTLHCHGTLHNK